MFDKEHKEVVAYLPPGTITGYEYEVEAAPEQSHRAKKECLEMPHDETVRVMGDYGWNRKSWAMRFRFMSDEML